MIDARYLVDYASDAAFAIDGKQRIVAWNYRARNCESSDWYLGTYWVVAGSR